MEKSAPKDEVKNGPLQYVISTSSERNGRKPFENMRSFALLSTLQEM